MRYIVEWNDEVNKWMIWDNDRFCHCGFFAFYLEANYKCKELNSNDEVDENS